MNDDDLHAAAALVAQHLGNRRAPHSIRAVIAWAVAARLNDDLAPALDAHLALILDQVAVPELGDHAADAPR